MCSGGMPARRAPRDPPSTPPATKSSGGTAMARSRRWAGCCLMEVANVRPRKLISIERAYQCTHAHE